MLWKLSAGIHHISVGHISENVSNISVMLPTRFPSTFPLPFRPELIRNSPNGSRSH